MANTYLRYAGKNPIVGQPELYELVDRATDQVVGGPATEAEIASQVWHVSAHAIAGHEDTWSWSLPGDAYSFDTALQSGKP